MCEYGKSFNIQCSLLSFFEKWKKLVDSEGCTCQIVMDFSKEFDTINVVLTTKLYDSWFIV